jgi:hypothetical protein
MVCIAGIVGALEELETTGHIYILCILRTFTRKSVGRHSTPRGTNQRRTSHPNVCHVLRFSRSGNERINQTSGTDVSLSLACDAKNYLVHFTALG